MYVYTLYSNDIVVPFDDINNSCIFEALNFLCDPKRSNLFQGFKKTNKKTETKLIMGAVLE